jgi:ABC-2 type transport system permease protein
VAWSDPGTVVFVVLMPLLMVAIMKDLFASALTAQGIPDANGSEFAVPGLAVAFAAFNAGYAGFGFFRDHGWGTWDRLRATPASSVDLMAGKIVPAVLVTILQLGLLFVLGGPLFGLTIKGSIAGLILIIVVLALCLAAFGMAITAVSRTMQQLNALGGVGGVALAMLGGAWVPVETMPGWARAMAPGLPTYWAMKGFESIIIKGEGVGAVLVPVLVVAGFGVLFTTLAALRFRFDEPKVYYG